METMETIWEFISLKRPDTDLVISKWSNNERGDDVSFKSVTKNIDNTASLTCTAEHDPNNVNIDKDVWRGKKFSI